MKKLFLITLLTSFLALTYSCDEDRINASGEVVSQDISVDDFSSIKVYLPAQVFVTQNPNQRLVIETHSNLFDVIETEVINGELRIGSEANINNIRTLNIYVQAEDFDLIGLAGSGAININDCIITDQLDIRLSGSGDINMCGTIGSLDVQMSGSGEFNGTDLTLESFQTRTSGSGEINASGSAKNVTFIVSGSGDINSFGLQSTVVTVDVSGSGNIETSVSNSLDVSITGSGSVLYKGSPDVISNISGSGTIQKMN